MKFTEENVTNILKRIDPTFEENVHPYMVIYSDLSGLLKIHHNNDSFNHQFILDFILAMHLHFQNKKISFDRFNIETILKRVTELYFNIQNIHLIASGGNYLTTVEKTINQIIPNYEKILENIKDEEKEIKDFKTNLKRPMFEYKMEEINFRHINPHTEEDLNFVGEDGWELITVNFVGSGERSIGVFKRIKFL